MRLTLVTLVVLGSLAVSCADETADPGSGSDTSSGLVDASLPENLCDEVLSSVPTEYGVTEVGHATDESEASCSLASGSGATMLDLRLTAVDEGGLDDAFAALCEETVQPEPDGQEDRRCTATSDTQVVQAVSLSSRSAVLLMTLVSDDAEILRTAGIDLALVESAVQNP